MRANLDAILKVKKPENVTQLRSFLGLVQYYGKFLQNLVTEAHPLNELLEKTRDFSSVLVPSYRSRSYHRVYIGHLLVLAESDLWYAAISRVN
jgi:hypothetical protein